jgi:hypothetical protein
VIYALLVDDLADGFAAPQQVRAELDKRLAQYAAPPPTHEEHIRRWATSPEAKAGQDAALALARRPR